MIFSKLVSHNWKRNYIWELYCCGDFWQGNSRSPLWTTPPPDHTSEVSWYIGVFVETNAKTVTNIKHSTLTMRARVRVSPSPRHFCSSAFVIYLWQFIHIAALDPGVYFNLDINPVFRFSLSKILNGSFQSKWTRKLTDRMWQIIVFNCWFASAIITICYTRQGMLPGEWKLCTVVRHWKSKNTPTKHLCPMTGVIICCKRFGPHGKSAYKN